MRLSCNGCRALRKACSEDCSIRPCLQWINCPDAQANATLFLAKFYGRSGLLNLVNAGPDHQRPAIFRSLLYEACGRILSPLNGSVGLLWSGSWQLCQTAVRAVLEGQPIARIPSDSLTAASTPVTLLKACDIRHVSRESRASRASAELHKVAMPPKRFKRSSANASKSRPAISSFQFDPARFDLNQTDFCSIDFQLAQSHESARQAPALVMDQGVSAGEKKYACPVETTEASHERQTNPVRETAGLELTLG